MMRQGGFTLIETLMVVVLLGIIGSGLLMYFVGLSATNQALVIEGASLAQDKMEKVLADSKAGDFNAIVSEPAAPLAAPYARFTRSVEAWCVQEADLDTQSGTMPACSDSDIKAKRIKVTVSWAGGAADLTTVITDH